MTAEPETGAADPIRTTPSKNFTVPDDGEPVPGRAAATNAVNVTGVASAAGFELAVSVVVVGVLFVTWTTAGLVLRA